MFILSMYGLSCVCLAYLYIGVMPKQATTLLCFHTPSVYTLELIMCILNVVIFGAIMAGLYQIRGKVGFIVSIPGSIK